MTPHELHNLQISTAVKVLLFGIAIAVLGAFMKWSKWYWILFGVFAAFCIWRYWIPR